MIKHPLRHKGLAVRCGLLKCALVASLALTTVWAQAQDSLQPFKAVVQGGFDLLRMEGTRPLSAVPTGFTVHAPAHMALDGPRMGSRLDRNTAELHPGKLRSADGVQADEHSRMEINLKQAATDQARLDGRYPVVMVEGPEAATAATSVTAVSKETNDPKAVPLKDVDFRRGVGHAGRVVVDLLSPQVGVDIRRQGSTLVVEFLQTSLPEGLRRRLDVSDFGTPVQSITTAQVGDRVRMVVTAQGHWAHSADQGNHQWVLEIREQKADPAPPTPVLGYTGEKLSLNFQNIEVRSLLQVIADFTNFNVVASDSVSGSVTLRLKDVPWDQALDIIMQAKGLGLRRLGNVLWIAPKEEIAVREKQELEAKASVESLETLRTQGFQMNYAKAADLALHILPSVSSGSAPHAARFLSPRGSVIAEPRTNQLFVTDIPARLEQMQVLIDRLDVPIRQVLIEARIVEADDRFARSIGVRLGGSNLGEVGGGDIRMRLGGAYNATGMGSGNTSFLNLPSTGVTGFTPAAFAVSLFDSAKTRFINLEISALEADGRGKIVSSPRIVTADQVKALIEQGTEYPYETATSSGATAIAFRKANLKLEVTPQITPEGGIIMEVDINKDSRGETTAAGIAINTKHIQTQVLVENGGTVVIGGIYELIEMDDVTKVPLLGDMPYVGNLFKNRSRTARKSELLVFLTPRVITDRGLIR